MLDTIDPQQDRRTINPMTKYKIIHNPTADKGVSVKMIPQIDQLLRKHDLDFGIVHTE